MNILAAFARADAAEVPIVGHGRTFIDFEPILKNNLEAFRQRLLARQAAADKDGKHQSKKNAV